MAESRNIDRRFLDSNPGLWAEIQKIDYQVRNAINWGLQVTWCHESHPCGENWCQRSLPDPSVIERCVDYLDAFFHVCENVDVTRANHLAALALLYLHQKVMLPLHYLASAAKLHHGQHGCHLPWCLDME